jgi:hypothetical protein
MAGKAHIVDLKNPATTESENEKARTLKLISGRKVTVSSRENEDLLEIFEPEGKMVLKVRLTDKGPVMVVEGCRLALNSTESIALRAPTIEISADEKTLLESKGTLTIDSAQEMGIHSEDDIRVAGKIIHLN